MSKEKLKIRPECLNCKHFSGDTPEKAGCAKGNTPTCYNKLAFIPAASHGVFG